MPHATVGSRYQVVIPKSVRQFFGLQPFSRVSIEARSDCIVIYPETAASLRGIGAAVADGTDASDYVKRLRAEWKSAK